MAEDNIDYLTSLPDNYLIDIILPSLPIERLNLLCRGNSRLNNICRNQRLWRHKTLLDYPQYYNTKPSNETWKEFYMTLHSRYVLVFEGNDFIGSIKIYSNDTRDNIEDEVIRLLRADDYNIVIYNIDIYDIDGGIMFDPISTYDIGYIKVRKPNNLTSLPLLPSNLQSLYCNNNNLTSLPPLPRSLQNLYCGNN